MTLACHPLVLSLSTTSDDFRAYHRLVFPFPKLRLAQNRCGSRVVPAQAAGYPGPEGSIPLFSFLVSKALHELVLEVDVTKLLYTGFSEVDSEPPAMSHFRQVRVGAFPGG
jgi:hypothetical protein